MLKRECHESSAAYETRLRKSFKHCDACNLLKAQKAESTASMKDSFRYLKVLVFTDAGYQDRPINELHDHLRAACVERFKDLRVFIPGYPYEVSNYGPVYLKFHKEGGALFEISRPNGELIMDWKPDFQNFLDNYQFELNILHHLRGCHHGSY